jgi:hypothetical protein
LQSTNADRTGSNGASGNQREALKAALRDGAGLLAITPVMVLAIQHICTDARERGQGPERSLVEFKVSLTAAANELEIPLGPERSKLFSGLVSTFIEELYRPASRANGKPRAFDPGDTSQASASP